MMLGLRTAAWANIGGGVPTAKDYVQDGLVAMRGGIENAGWGVHDPNATVWKDLVGDCDLPFTNYGEFTDKYLHGLSTSRGHFSVSANIVQIEAIIKSGVFTFGGVMRTSSVCPNYGSGIRFVNNTNMMGYSNVRNGTSPFTEVRTRFQVGRSGTQTNVLGAYHTNTEHQVIVVANGTASDVYVDGVKDVSSVISDERINSLFLDGASDYGNIFVYNRDLTGDEIAYNYEIDKARFGII